MSFSGMQSTSALIKRSGEGNGFGWIFGLSMAATLSIVMKWWMDHVLNKKKTKKNKSIKKSAERSNGVNGTMEEKRDTTSKSNTIVPPGNPEANKPMTFEEAASTIRNANISVSTSDQLMLYGLYKQATQGNAPMIEWSLSFADQSKHRSWAQCRDMPKAIAEAQYVEHATEILKNGQGTKSSTTFGTGASSRPVAIDSVPKGDLTPEQRLMAAAGENDMDSLRVQLEGDVNVDQRDDGGQSALHMAADAGALDAVELLLKHGANVLAADQYGISVLQAAVIAGQVEVCELLLEHGADPDQPDQDGDTPRLCAEDDGGWEMREMFTSRGSVKDSATHVMDDLKEEEEEDAFSLE